MKYIEGIHRKSKISFPASIDDYITEDNPVRVMDAFVLSLNMKDLGFKNTNPDKKEINERIQQLKERKQIYKKYQQVECIRFAGHVERLL